MLLFSLIDVHHTPILRDLEGGHASDILHRSIATQVMTSVVKKSFARAPVIVAGIRSSSRRPSLTAWIRVHLAYAWRHRRLLRLATPTRFTELVQWRKLYDRETSFSPFIDKLAVKSFVARRLGNEWVTPTLWSGAELPDSPPCRPPFVVKSSHGCNQKRIVRTGLEDWAEIQRASRRWMSRDYGRWLDEHAYRNIPRNLMIEPFIGTDGALPVDYKLFVFHGVVAFIQVHLDREYNHRWLVFDTQWKRVSSPNNDPDPPKPAMLTRMIEGAELLGAEFDFVRVDLYDCSGSPRFGEMTFYPGSGLDPVDPPALDFTMGALW